MPKSITSRSISEFVDALWARPWLLPLGTESWPARTPWVLGFFSSRGNRLYSEGEPVLVLSRKGKEDCPELLTVLAAILKENYLLDPCVVSSTRSGECRFSSGKICARTNGSPERKDSTAREHQKKTLVGSTLKSPPPLPRGWIAAAKCSRGPTVEREENKKKQIRKKIL